MQWFLLLIGLGIISLLYVILAVRRRNTKIPFLVRSKLLERWEEAIEVPDVSRRVLEAEKVCDAVLKALGYQGTFAEKLQVAGPRLTHVEELWSAHKLRNRIAHELNCRVSDTESRRAVQAFASLIHQFLA